MEQSSRPWPPFTTRREFAVALPSIPPVNVLTVRKFRVSQGGGVFTCNAETTSLCVTLCHSVSGYVVCVKARCTHPRSRPQQHKFDPSICALSPSPSPEHEHAHGRVVQAALVSVAGEVLESGAKDLLPLVQDDYVWACIAAAAPIMTRCVSSESPGHTTHHHLVAR